MDVIFDPGKLNIGGSRKKKKKKRKAKQSIGGNICKLHLVHVHLHWLCIPTHFNLLFFLDQSATPATPVTFSNTRFSSSFHLPSLPPNLFGNAVHTKLVSTSRLLSFFFSPLLSSIPLRIYSCSIETCSSICIL